MLRYMCQLLSVKPFSARNASSILPEGDDGVDCEGSLASIIKSLLTNSIQESSQIAASGSNSTGSTLVRETEKAFAASCPTAFLKSLMAATSRSYISCGTSGAMSTRLTWTCQPRGWEVYVLQGSV